MDTPSLKFIETPSSPLQETIQNRHADWHENGEHILQLFEKHAEEYRIKICVNCDKAQQKNRRCYKSDELDSNGNLKTSCEHMTKAGCKKLKDIRSKHIDFHPLFFNPK